MKGSGFVTAAVALAAILLLGCSPARSDEPGGIRVVATIYPLYELSQQVGGDRVSVRLLVPPGVEAHDWEPTAQDLRAIEAARVFVYSGAGFEPWVARALDQIDSARTISIDAAQGLDLLPASEEEHAGGQGERGGFDPHFWLDPTLAAAAANHIQEGLSTADPPGAALYSDNVRAYVAELEALDRDLNQGLRGCAQNQFVTAHAAFGYLARRYGLEQVPIAGISPDAEPTPSRLAELKTFLTQSGVRYVFTETLVSPALAETLAREVGAQTLVLNPVEGLTPEETARGETYVSVMRHNLEALRTALECR